MVIMSSQKSTGDHSKVKQMMIIAYDHQGIIMTDRVPCGTSVTAVYYRDWLQKLSRNRHKNRHDLLGDGSFISHDNAHPHLGKVVTDLLSKYEWEGLPHAPYSPYMSLPDFNLFHKLKNPCVDTVFPPRKRFLQRLPEPSED
jgi:hypothetical protein